MLFKQPTLLLDLTGSHSDNYIRGEVRYIRSAQDAIFCLSKGNYYVNNLSVTNNLTGEPLIIHQDYNPIQLYEKASLDAKQPVWAAMRITNPDVTEVKIDYQAIGGQYQDMLNVILEIKDNLDPDYIATFPWEKIQNKPLKFKVAEHPHSLWDWTNLRGLLNSIYQVVVALYANQREDYFDLYNHLAAVFTARAADINDRLSKLNDRVEWYRNAMHYDDGDILPSMNPEVPSNYLKYGQWVLIPDVLLMGAGHGDTIGELIGLQGSNPGDENAMRVYFWQRVDDKASVLYNVTASATMINEGDSVTFTISSPGRAAGTAVGWKLTGVGANDVVGELRGTAFLNSSGSTTVTVDTVADGLSEGVERLRLEIIGDMSRFAEVQVMDTSTNPSYRCYFSFDSEGITEITDAAEGDLVYLIIVGTNIAPIAVYSLLYDGSTVDNADFLQAMPDTVTLVDGFAAVPFNILKDKRSEGYEVLVAYMSNTSSIDQAVVATRIRIYDSSLTPTYASRLTSDADGNLPVTNVGEGQTFYLHLFTTDIEDGAEITLSYSGTLTNADFDSTPPLKATIVNGYARIRYDVKADNLSESAEYMDIYILQNGKLIGEERILVNDTSTNGGFVAYFSSNRFGTNNLSWVNEGDQFFLIMQAAGYPNGTQLKLQYSGQAIASDFVDSLPATLVIDDEVGFQVFNVAADRVSEGDENFVVTVLDGDRVLASTNITLLDTSKEPVYNLQFTRDQSGRQPILELNEGERVYVHVSGVNINAITTLGVDVFVGGIRANLVSGDVSELPPSSITLVEGKGSFYIQTRADSVTENDQQIEVRLRSSELSTAPVVKSGTVLLRDTSKDPTWHVAWTVDQAGLIPWESSRPLLEGESIYLQWTSENIPNGTVYWLNYPTTATNTVVAEDFLDARPDHFTVMNNRATVRYRIRADYIIDQGDNDEEVFDVDIHDNVSMTSKILGLTIRIPDPTFTSRFSGNVAAAGSISTANEGDIIYFIIDTTNVPDNAQLKLEHYVNGNLVTVKGYDFVEDPAQTVSITNNRGIVGVGIRTDALPDGNKTFQIQVHGLNAAPGAIPLAVSTVNLIDTSVGGVTEDGTYRPVGNAIGSISIGAGESKHIILMGGGGSGVTGTMESPVGQPYDGYDGEATALRIGSTTLAIAGAGEGGLRGRSEATPGGTTYINHNVFANYSQLLFEELVEIPGRVASIDSAAGANSSNEHNAGAGAAGSLTGTGGGSGATVFLKITNNGTSLMTFGVLIGRGGLRVAGNGQQWNDGAIVVST